jgi:hypothetical protein
MYRETPSPVDLPDPIVDDVEGFGWASTAIAVAAIVLLATNSVSLKDWIDDQPPSPLQARAADAADMWLTAMRAVGIAGPRDVLHDAWKGAENARFGDEDGGDTAR